MRIDTHQSIKSLTLIIQIPLFFEPLQNTLHTMELGRIVQIFKVLKNNLVMTESVDDVVCDCLVIFHLHHNKSLRGQIGI